MQYEQTALRFVLRLLDRHRNAFLHRAGCHLMLAFDLLQISQQLPDPGIRHLLNRLLIKLARLQLHQSGLLPHLGNL